MAPGALTVATKELIALAIGVCEQETPRPSVTLMMKGGPASIDGPRAYAALTAFARAARER